MEIDVTADRIDDERALVEHLTPSLGAPDSVEMRDLDGGNANETVRLDWDGDAYVVRIPPEFVPAPALLGDPERECAALSAVESTPVPAPTVVHRCTDEDVLGEEFLVMELLEGEVLDQRMPDRFDSPAARAAIVDDVATTLAALHEVEAPEDFASDPRTPAAALERKLETYRDQLTWAEARTADRRRVEGLATLADRLAGRIPERTDPDEVTLVHGDYKPDNLMVADGSTPELVGVLDWELAGRGDPLADLGWLLSYWSDPADPAFLTDEIRDRYGDHEFFPVLELFVEEYAGLTAHPDTPSRRDVVERYEAASGRTYRDDEFYRALGTLKLGVICEGFFRAYLEDAPNVKESYPAMELIPFVLAEQGLRTLDGDVPLGG